MRGHGSQLFFVFFKYETTETHARAFLPLAVGSVPEKNRSSLSDSFLKSRKQLPRKPSRSKLLGVIFDILIKVMVPD